jgi:lipopolysaccharide export system permease protein
VKILSRYIVLEILRFTGLCLGVFLGILVTARILKLTSLVVNKGINAVDIILVFVSIIPSFLEIAIPMSVLLGTMLAFARLSLDSEIVVIRASGINLSGLLRPVFFIGVGFTILSFLTSVYLRPLGNTELAKSLFKLASQATTANLTEGVFNELGTITIYAQKIDRSEGTLEHVLIDDRRDSGNRMIITSKNGSLYSDEDQRMLNLELTEGAIHTNEANAAYTITDFESNTIRIDPQELANKQAAQGKKAREMFLHELHEARNSLVNNTPEAAALTETLPVYEIELSRKLAMPFAALILALLAMPLGIHPPRSQNTWGQSLSFMIGMIIFVLYYALLSIGMSLAKDGSLSATISLWIPNIIFGIITLIAVKQMGSERWHSVIHALSDLIGNFARRLGIVR